MIAPRRTHPVTHAATGHARAPATSSAGMTLIELLAAITIFLGLAGMVMQVLGGGLDLWTTGESSRQYTEQASVLLDRLADELHQVVTADRGEGEPRVKMFADFVERDTDGDGVAEFRGQRLLFVRNLFEERTHPALQEAGYHNGGTAYFTGTTGGAGAEGMAAGGLQGDGPEALRATEGLTEVCLFVSPDFRTGYEGRLVLWRAMRSPIGGEDSLFASVADRHGLPEDVPAAPLAENLLYVGWEFLDSKSEDAPPDDDPSHGPLVTWDSTRGLLPPGNSPDSFRYGLGPASAGMPDDDVFPRAIRVTIVVEAPPGDSYRATLLEELAMTATAERVSIQNGGFLSRLGAGSHLVRVGHEWIEISECNGREMMVRRRGLLGTAPVTHPEGTPVQVGRRFQRTILLPSYREDLNRRDVQENP